MYVKTSVRKTKTGEVRYLQLAHNEWDAAKGRSVPKVIYGFGREDQLDKEAVRRLVASLSRLLEPGEVPAAAGRRAGVRRVQALRRRVRAGPAVAAARHRDDPGRARLAPAGAGRGTPPRRSGSCSAWSRTGRSRRRRSWRRRSG